ncbi:MAG: 50S ribosomal protein L29 [Verrucomicrobiota bacterium]
MKLKEIKELGLADLSQREVALRKELFSLRIQKQVNTLENPLRLRSVRRELARVLTVAGAKSLSK